MLDWKKLTPSFPSIITLKLSTLTKELKKCFELEKKARSASIDTKRSSSTEMALRVFGGLLILSLALEFSGLCEGQYQCLFTSCRKREVRQLRLNKWMILQAYTCISWKPNGKTFTVKSSYLWLVISDVLENYFKQATKRPLWMEKFHVRNIPPFGNTHSLFNLKVQPFRWSYRSYFTNGKIHLFRHIMLGVLKYFYTELVTFWRSCRTSNLPKDTDNSRTAFGVNFLRRW